MNKITHINQPVSLEAAAPLEPDIERDLLRAYIDSAHDGIFVVCDEMKFHVANPVLAGWLGVSEAELTAHTQRLPITRFLGHTELAAEFEVVFPRVLRGEAVRLEGAIHPLTGDPRWVEITLKRVQIPHGDLVIGVARDVSERKRLYSILQHNASHDDLTGLVNRREFQQRLNALVESARVDKSQHALVYVDLDQFKVVNDVCGHQAGDELLRHLGVKLQACVQGHDLIARLGGDEFGVLLHDTPIEQAMQTAEALCDAVQRFHFSWQERSFDVTASVGLCAITSDTENAETVLSQADAACYVAKDKGRNRVQLYFGGKACTGKRAEMEWVTRIQKVLETDRFQLWHQNILGLTDSSERNFEVLLRMLDEDDKVIAPGIFFPAAEHYGLMPAIDRWVVSQLLMNEPYARLHQSMSADLTVRCAINLSGASLNDDKFLVFLEDALKASRVPAESICFEITETVAIANLQRFSEVMQALKRLGCKFALDDFGSGMSSFGYLKTLPVDYLKIDGALVKHIATDAANLTMVEAIHRIARVLGIQTIAEFVEDDATLHILREIGVDYAQGYGIHKPAPLQF